MMGLENDILYIANHHLLSLGEMSSGTRAALAWIVLYALDIDLQSKGLHFQKVIFFNDWKSCLWFLENVPLYSNMLDQGSATLSR